ncbi:MAG: hypothetical protein ACC726_12500, partial [Chloroflexota bacterium]
MSGRSRIPDQGASSRQANPTHAGPRIDLEDLWSQSRSGARNVAGVTYQVAVTGLLLAEALDGTLPISFVSPEGLDDVECRLTDGSFLLVQCKEREAGLGRLTTADIASVISRAARAALSLGNTRIVLVTDAELGSGLQFTGWDSSIAATHPSDRLQEVVRHVRDVEVRDAQQLVEQASLVHLEWDLASRTRVLLASRLGIAPSLAHLVHARLMEDLSEVS